MSLPRERQDAPLRIDAAGSSILAAGQHHPDGNTLDFFYDAQGNPYAVKYNGTLYYYITNLQGDVLHIVDTSGNTVVSYTYSPYGKPLTTTGTLASTLGAANPLRYRGYYFDSDSGLYYLQSRYYDPEIGRFINADSYASTGQGILGCNMFAYCRNNPISRKDASGTHDMCIINFNEDSNPFNDLVSPSGGGGGGNGGGIATRKNASDLNSIINNPSEEVVFDAEYFAFYKGALVVYHSSEYLTSWAWGGVIFLNRDSKNKTTLAHEYGHILREREYGTAKYTSSVFLPSTMYNIASRYNSTLHDNYYNMPWEYDAEVNGEVNRAYNYADWAPGIRECYFAIWDVVYYE